MKKAIKILSIICTIYILYEAYNVMRACDSPSDVALWVCLIVIVLFGSSVFQKIFWKFGPRKQAPVDWNQHSLTIDYRFYHREVEWTHITGFSTFSYQGTKWVLVHVDNIDELMASTRNWFKRLDLTLTINQFGTPYAITADRLVVTPQELCDELNQELEKRRTASTRIL